MKLRKFMEIPEGRPLDQIRPDGGFCGIFRTIGCIGDSLSSGEFESLDEAGNKGYHDEYDYSWGQYLARIAGCKAYNFSRGGMTAKEYWDTFAEENDFWNPDKLCQAYIIALGVNDLFGHNQEIGSVADICPEDWNQNKETFAGYYARIIQRLRSMQPQARFFLMTMPRETTDPAKEEKKQAHSKLLYDLAEYFPYTYVLDFHRYAPVYDQAFKERFFLGGHMNPRWVPSHRPDDRQLHRLHRPQQHGGFRPGRLHRQALPQHRRKVVKLSGSVQIAPPLDNSSKTIYNKTVRRHR